MLQVECFVGRFMELILKMYSSWFNWWQSFCWLMRHAMPVPVYQMTRIVLVTIFNSLLVCRETTVAFPMDTDEYCRPREITMRKISRRSCAVSLTLLFNGTRVDVNINCYSFKMTLFESVGWNGRLSVRFANNGSLYYSYKWGCLECESLMRLYRQVLLNCTCLRFFRRQLFQWFPSILTT